MQSLHYLNKYITLQRLLRSQWNSISSLEESQLKKLKKMVKFAYENCEYYHSLMKRIDIRPSDVKKLEDIQKFPVLTKNSLKSSFDKIMPRNINLKNCWRPYTSGSTGIPLRLAFDKKAEDFTNAVLLRANFAVGQKIRDNWVSIINQKRKKTWFQKFGIINQTRMFHLSPEAVFNEISKIQPRIISGYASSIFLLSRYIQKYDKIDVIRPELVFTVGEVLQPNMRKFINETFDIEVFDRFGCAELGRTAWECENHESYHIDSEAVIVEILGNDNETLNNEEFGQVAYTGLYNFSLPLIRYVVGDIAAKNEEQCPCGRGLPLMKITGGRTDDFLINNRGEIISFRDLTTVLREFNEILQFKVIQENPELLILEIIPDEFWNRRSSNKITSAIQNVIGNGVEIIINLVDEIKPEKSGKILSVVSRIDFNPFSVST